MPDVGRRLLLFLLFVALLVALPPVFARFAVEPVAGPQFPPSLAGRPPAKESR